MVRVMLGNYPGIADAFRLQASLPEGVDLICWPPYGAFFPPQGRAPDPRVATVQAGCELAGWSDPPDLYISWATECRPMPADLASSGVPVAVNIGDWNLSGRLLHDLEDEDLPLILDTPGKERLGERFKATFEAFPWGWDPSLWPLTPPTTNRDVDVLFVGSRNTAIHRSRERIVNELAHVAETSDFNIQIHTWMPTPEYQQLAARSKVILNFSVRGEANMRNFEALAAGSRLLVESSNKTVPRILIPGVEYETFEPGSIRDCLTRVLHDWDPRAHPSAQARLDSLTFDALIADFIAESLEHLQRSARPLRSNSFIRRQWLHANDQACTDPTLYAFPAERARAALVDLSIGDGSHSARSTRSVAALALQSASELSKDATDWLVLAELALAAGSLSEADRFSSESASAERLGDISSIPVPDFSWWRLDLERRLLSLSGPARIKSARDWLQARARYIQYLATDDNDVLRPLCGSPDTPQVPELLLAMVPISECPINLLEEIHSIDRRNEVAASRLADMLCAVGRRQEAEKVLSATATAQIGAK